MVRNFAYRDHPSANAVHIAPTEYHVGVRPMTHSIINVEDDEDDEGEEEVEEEEEESINCDKSSCVPGCEQVTGLGNKAQAVDCVEEVSTASGDGPTSNNWRAGVTTTAGSPLKNVATPSPADSDYPLSVQSCSDKASSGSHVSSPPTCMHRVSNSTVWPK